MKKKMDSCLRNADFFLYYSQEMTILHYICGTHLKKGLCQSFPRFDCDKKTQMINPKPERKHANSENFQISSKKNLKLFNKNFRMTLTHC